ncbi:hypothetical protein TrRE_jg3787 [Triparma retinervis]|uniref:Uncharacterized protein n=1 Tax=Triparma retinervis TaxID=2557542 RepID=A0A9W7CF60_9STRA|nr:hypothetical protein TrRE_jg3787 [Triparma retinervis]
MANPPHNVFRDDVVSRAKLLKRLKLDLDVEANPIESKFSSSLMDLMQREEAAVAQGRHEFVENASRKVMNGLCAETNKHCGLQSASNQSRWRKLFEEQSEERQQMFHESFTAAGVAYNDRSRRGAGGARRGEQSLEEAFEAEEERLELDAFINYGKYETFNLDNAFGLQLARVDAEWAVYEQQMVNDYESQKAAILGKKGRGGGARGYVEARGNWKSKEKQSRLFNTAPVFSPEGGLGRGGGAHNAELQHLENVFSKAKDRISHQKKNAIRWIKRQEARMKIQVEHTMGDRRVIYPCLLKEKDDFERFFDQVASMGAEKKNGKKKAEDVVAGGGGGLSVSKKKLAGKFRDAVDVDTEDSSEVDTSRDLATYKQTP